MGRAAAPGRGRHRAPPNSSGHTEANHSSFSYLFEGFCTPDQVVPADIGKRPQLLQLILGETCAPPSTTPDVRPRQTVRTVAVVISEADTGSALTHVRDIRPKFPQDYGDPSRHSSEAGRFRDGSIGGFPRHEADMSTADASAFSPPDHAPKPRKPGVSRQPPTTDPPRP